MRFSHYLSISCGSRHLAVARLRMNPSGRCVLEDYWIKEIDFATTEPLIWLKAISQEFAGIRKRFSGETPVGYVLPGNLVLSKFLKVPQAPEKKRSKIISFEARQNIPYPLSEVTWDDALISEDELDFETVIAAARTELVESLARYGRESSLEADVIVPSFVALLNGFRFNYPELEEPALLISIGARTTDLIFISRDSFFSRNISLGGNSITQEIAGTLGSSFEEAERIKRASLSGEPTPSNEYNAFEEAKKRFESRLALESSRTLAIYRQHSTVLEPKSCYLTGGGALISGIGELLSDRLDITVEKYDPLRKVRPANPDLASALEKDRELVAECVGLGIGRFLPDAREINLLPQSILWQRRFKRQQPYYLAAGLIACAAVAIPLVSSKVEIDRYRQEIQNLDTKIQPLRSLTSEINLKAEEVERMSAFIGEARDLIATKSNWIEFLNDVQARLTSVEDVWIDRLDVVRPTSSNGQAVRFSDRNPSENTNVRFRIEGRLIDVGSPLSTVSQTSNQRVNELLARLSDSEFVSALENERFDASTPGILKFNFTLVMNEERPL